MPSGIVCYTLIPKETLVSTENWAEERERLSEQLRKYESGEITDFDDDGAGHLVSRETTAERAANMMERLAILEARLGITAS